MYSIVIKPAPIAHIVVFIACSINLDNDCAWLLRSKRLSQYSFARARISTSLVALSVRV